MLLAHGLGRKNSEAGASGCQVEECRLGLGAGVVPGGLSETSLQWSSEREGALGVRVVGQGEGARAFRLEGPPGALESSRAWLVLLRFSESAGEFVKIQISQPSPWRADGEVWGRNQGSAGVINT